MYFDGGVDGDEMHFDSGADVGDGDEMHFDGGVDVGEGDEVYFYGDF